MSPGGLRRDTDDLPRVCLSQFGEACAFGPLVICAVYLDAQGDAALADLDRNAWPRYAPDVLRRTARRASLVVPYDTVELAPRKYNTLLSKMSLSRNRVLNWCYKKALETMLERYPAVRTISFDLHAPAFAVLAADVPRGDTVGFVYRGLEEPDAGLAAAGVLARATYERGLKAVERAAGGALPAPDEDPVPAITRILATGGSPLLMATAKRDDPRVDHIIAPPGDAR